MPKGSSGTPMISGRAYKLVRFRSAWWLPATTKRRRYPPPFKPSYRSLRLPLPVAGGSSLSTPEAVRPSVTSSTTPSNRSDARRNRSALTIPTYTSWGAILLPLLLVRKRADSPELSPGRATGGTEARGDYFVVLLAITLAGPPVPSASGQSRIALFQSGQSVTRLHLFKVRGFNSPDVQVLCRKFLNPISRKVHQEGRSIPRPNIALRRVKLGHASKRPSALIQRT